MTYKELEELSKNWTGKVCIFGAGLIGRTWGYDIIACAGFEVDCYCDNYMAEGENIQHGIETTSFSTLSEQKEDYLVFVTVDEKKQGVIIGQLVEAGFTNYISIDYLFLQKFCESVLITENQNLLTKYKDVIEDEAFIKKQFKYKLGYELNLSIPKSLNEKIQWLKLNDRKEIHTMIADKYAVREYIKEKFGEEYLVPLLFTTTDSGDLVSNNIPEKNCIIKTNGGCGDYTIIRDRNKVDWNLLQQKYKKALEKNHYYKFREWQYKNISPMIMVEELLELESGSIPNDYKLHFFNGKCEFIYCSIDREGANYRKIYDEHWKPLTFYWVANPQKEKDKGGDEIEPPLTFAEMLRIGKEVAKNFKYVRVDFYDVDGKLYCGEITLHHGGGFDKFEPQEYDLYYGSILNLK